MTTPVYAPDWSVHAPKDAEGAVSAGGTQPGAWTVAWAAAPERAVVRTPDGWSMTATGLAERTAAAAGRYAAAGLAPGDRVLMSAAPSVDLIVAYVAAIRAGLTVVPANTTYTGRELAHLVSDSGPRLAVVDEPGRLDGLGVPVTGPDLGGLPARGAATLDRAAPEDTALIVYTSGTTGPPKGALLTHANLLATAHAVRLAWRWQPDDTLALCLPLFHVHGLGVGLHGTLVTGASLVLLPKFEPGAVAAAIDGHGATMFFGVPTMYHRLAASPHLGSLGGLRLAVSGSAPLPAELHAALAAGSGQKILERYGMTETGMLVSNPYEGERRPGTVGFPLPGVSVRLTPRAGGTAEIEVRGPNVSAGYLNRPAGSSLVDGWFRTGDLGTLDPDGYLRISGRATELIISGGYNVYPREVEEVLREHPGVADAAVVGAPSTEWGEAVVAFVVPAGAGDAAALQDALAQWCAERLAPYKRPRAWRWIEAVPRNALGKVLRHELHP
jgi:malonyl-CoA/methylmalonyl-CoA synthetase